MNVVMNCCKPASMFKGEKAEVKTEKVAAQPKAAVDAKAQPAPKLKGQPEKDTVEISAKTPVAEKKPEAKCQGPNCAK